MAMFDLKKATIYIKDGYTLAGTIASTAPAVGATTLTSANFVGAIATGDLFIIGSGATQYKVTAHTETTSNTTSITFTPAIPTGTVITVGDVIQVLPHILQVKLVEGNATYNEKKARQYIKDRGILATVRNGDQDPIDVKLDFMWEFLRADTGMPPSIEDALKKRGNASTWVSSASDPCEPYAVDIGILYVNDCGNVTNELITLPDFRYEELAHDSKAGMVNVTGKCNVTEASVARVSSLLPI